MDALRAIKGRRSIRAFESAPVDRKSVETIVDAGRLAATGYGAEPWEFIVVCDPMVREQLAGICDYGQFIAQSPVCIVVLCREIIYYLEDGSAATENMLVAAHALGLGACWVAGDKKPYADRIAKMLGAPASYKLVSLVAVGYPAQEQPPRKTKRPLSQVLHWERF